MLLIGSAVAEIPFELPVPQAGFAARSEPAHGIHDPITASAVAVGDTCLVVIDTPGLDREFCAELAAALAVPAEGVVVTATHTHAGPALMRGGLGTHSEAARETALRAGIDVARAALESRRPRRAWWADAGAVGVATDRRKGGRPEDARLRVLRWEAVDDGPEGWLLTYPCHPTVLGPDTLELSADYPGYVRAAVAEARPGAHVVFATGCAGDLNTGHLVSASYTGVPSADRTFAQAQKLGRRIAEAALSAAFEEVRGDAVAARRTTLTLPMEPVDGRDGAPLVPEWEAGKAGATPGQAAVLQCWIDWAARPDAGSAAEWTGSVTVARWGDVRVVALPGEPFLAAATTIEKESGAERLLCLGYADGTPGYFPMAADYPDGGYEVLDAHRYYGMPSPFARGSAERLVNAAVRELRMLDAD